MDMAEPNSSEYYVVFGVMFWRPACARTGFARRIFGTGKTET